MSLVTFNLRPADRHLRQFGCLLGLALPAVAWWWQAPWAVIGWLALAGAGAAALGLLAPRALWPVYVALTVVTTPIGIVFGELAMLMIYFGVFLPIGLAFRLLRRDALQRALDRSAASYWQPKEQPRDVRRYFRLS